MSDINRKDEFAAESSLGESAFSGAPYRRASAGREPWFTSGDMLAYAVALVMVCGPLAAGVFSA